MLPLVDHCVDMLRENFPRLQNDRLVSFLQISIDAKGALDRGGRANVLNGVNHDRLPHIAGINLRGSYSYLHNFEGPELVPFLQQRDFRAAFG